MSVHRLSPYLSLSADPFLSRISVSLFKPGLFVGINDLAATRHLVQPITKSRNSLLFSFQLLVQVSIQRSLGKPGVCSLLLNALSRQQ